VLVYLGSRIGEKGELKTSVYGQKKGGKNGKGDYGEVGANNWVSSFAEKLVWGTKGKRSERAETEGGGGGGWALPGSLKKKPQ